jgi:hypothetical protein
MSVVIEQWFLTILAFLPLQLANRAVITPPPLLNDKYEKRKIMKE